MCKQRDLLKIENLENNKQNLFLLKSSQLLSYVIEKLKLEEEFFLKIEENIFNIEKVTILNIFNKNFENLNIKDLNAEIFLLFTDSFEKFISHEESHLNIYLHWVKYKIILEMQIEELPLISKFIYISLWRNACSMFVNTLKNFYRNKNSEILSEKDVEIIKDINCILEENPNIYQPYMIFIIKQLSLEYPLDEIKKICNLLNIKWFSRFTFRNEEMKYNRFPWLKINELMPKLISAIYELNLEKIEKIIVNSANEKLNKVVCLLSFISTFYIKNEENVPSIELKNLLEKIMNNKDLFISKYKSLIQTFCYNKFTDDHEFMKISQEDNNNIHLKIIISFLFCIIAVDEDEKSSFLSKIAHNPQSLKTNYIPFIFYDPNAITAPLLIIPNDGITRYLCTCGETVFYNGCGNTSQAGKCSNCNLEISSGVYGQFRQGVKRLDIQPLKEINENTFLPKVGYLVHEKNFLPFNYKGRLSNERIYYIGHFMLHVSLLYAEMFNKAEDFIELDSRKKSLFEYLITHISNDWNILSNSFQLKNNEDLMIFLYQIFLFYLYSLKKQNMPLYLPNLSDANRRETWEKIFEKEIYTSGLLNMQANQVVANFIQTFNDDEKKEVIYIDDHVYEIVDLEKEVEEFKNIFLPCQLRKRVIPDEENFIYSLNLEKEKYPLLNYIVQIFKNNSLDEEQFDARKNYESLLEIYSAVTLVYERLNGKITEKEGRTITINQFIELQNDKEKVRQIFENFISCYLKFKDYLFQEGCDREIKISEINLDYPIYFLCIKEKERSNIHSYYLRLVLTSIISSYNTFVDNLIKLILNDQSKKVIKTLMGVKENNLKIVKLNNLNSSNIISVNPEILEKYYSLMNCVNLGYKQGTNVIYDFEEMEFRICFLYLSKICKIEETLPIFKFKLENIDESLIYEIKDRVKQQIYPGLKKEELERFIINREEKLTLFEQVSVICNYLRLNKAPKHAENYLIEDYCKRFRLEYNEKKVFDKAKLSHLVHIYEVSEELVLDLLIDETYDLYKENLSNKQEKEFKTVLDDNLINNEILLKGLGRFLFRFLRKDLGWDLKMILFDNILIVDCSSLWDK
jgi:hypothetical protein